MTKGSCGDNKEDYGEERDNKMTKNDCVCRSYVKDILIILAGDILYAISICLIDGIPTMPAGGVGIATVLHYITRQPVGRLNMMVNIPLMAVGTLVLGKKMLAYTGFVIVSSSLLIDWMLPLFPPHIGVHTLILTIIGAVLMGVSSGMIMSTGATFAGTSVIAMLISRKYPKIKVGTALIIMDGMVIISGAVVLKDVTALFYSGIYTVIVSWTINYFLYTLPAVRARRYIK